MNRFLKGKGDEGESFKKSEKYTDVSYAALLLVFVRYCANGIFTTVYFSAKIFRQKQLQINVTEYIQVVQRVGSMLT